MEESVKDTTQRLYDFWFSHKNIWFDATNKDDNIVVKMFGHLIPKLLELHAMDTTLPKKTWIGAILALDQISRHARRVDPSLCCVPTCTERALQISQHLLSECPSYSVFTCEEICFILLPMRHVNRVTEVIDILNEYISNYCNRIPPPIAKRFLRASYKRLMIAHNVNVVAEKEVLFSSRGDSIHPSNLPEVRVPKKWETFIQNTLQNGEVTTNHLLVSLSGGVDSVVLMACLLSMGYCVHAVYINYCNRFPTCEDEEAFVQQLCKSWGVPLTVRRFSEFTKKTAYVDREAYEEITKIARYDMYAKVSQQTTYRHVFLGHHKDDCLENIVTNLTNGKRLENLRGMSEVEHVMGVTVLRPFLSIHKQSILAFAEQHRISHLADNTNPKCTRGKIRTKLLPALDEYNTNFRHSLESLDKTMGDLYNVLNHYCDQILTTKKTLLSACITNAEAGVIRVTFEDGTYSIPVGFPAIAWRVFCNKLGVYNVSQRCLDNLVSKISTSHRVQKHALNKHHMIYISKPKK